MKKLKYIFLLSVIYSNCFLFGQSTIYFNNAYGMNQIQEYFSQVIPLNNKYYSLGTSATPSTNWK